MQNAIKFTPEGGRISVQLRPSENGMAKLSIRDSGEGIPKAFLPYVFDRFRQADSSSTRKQGGLGLGLAIVTHIV
ncbi:cell wall metabolism sensor histidine kinase WalK, partial [Klebsiella pneumoniae]|nr:cell wall metabolism sensor histidine kinase WalK [Klebsiella pneumoniae]